jgi:hypothetical protein
MATYMDGMDGGKHNSDDCITTFTPKKNKTNVICKEDVLMVGNHFNLSLSDEQIDEVLEDFDWSAKIDPTANWTEIVEQIFYNLEIL